VSHVRLSAQANLDLARLYEFLAALDLSKADQAIDTILAAFGVLEKMPLGCPPVVGRKDLRKLVIPFGASGYVAFYSHDHQADTSTIACVLHQKERYDGATVGRNFGNE
jgi:plasmid stabilization system protein ParE